MPIHYDSRVINPLLEPSTNKADNTLDIDAFRQSIADLEQTYQENQSKPQAYQRAVFLFHGTGNSSSLNTEVKSQNLISSLERSLKRDSNQFVHTFAGVGSKASKDAKDDESLFTPGQYVFVPDKANPGHGSKIKNPKLALNLRQKLGLILGYGLPANVIEAVQRIQALRDQGVGPSEINLTGFSRGAVTVLILSNVLNNLFPDIKLNITLVDPVPGPSWWRNKNIATIPPNVAHATIVLQKHETRPPFAAISKQDLIVSDPTKTKVEYEVLPGEHNAPIKFRSDETSGVTKLVTALITKNMQSQGVEFDKMPTVYANYKYKAKYNVKDIQLDDNDLTSQSLLAVYHNIFNNEPHYAKQRGFLGRNRGFISKLSEYVKDADFFLSQRHRDLFAEVLPKTFYYLFQGNTHNVYSADEVAQELAQLKRQNPQLHTEVITSLAEKNIRYANNQYHIPVVDGKRHTSYQLLSEKLPPSKQPLPTSDISNVVQTVPARDVALRAVKSYLTHNAFFYVIHQTVSKLRSSEATQTAIALNREKRSLANELLQELERIPNSNDPHTTDILLQTIQATINKTAKLNQNYQQPPGELERKLRHAAFEIFNLLQEPQVEAVKSTQPTPYLSDQEKLQLVKKIINPTIAKIVLDNDIPRQQIHLTQSGKKITVLDRIEELNHLVFDAKATSQQFKEQIAALLGQEDSSEIQASWGIQIKNENQHIRDNIVGQQKIANTDDKHLAHKALAYFKRHPLTVVGGIVGFIAAAKLAPLVTVGLAAKAFFAKSAVVATATGAGSKLGHEIDEHRIVVANDTNNDNDDNEEHSSPVLSKII
ncbi:MAG: hypothetical protein Tsb005_01970 [Gammaproteobacteria bacterium]